MFSNQVASVGSYGRAFDAAPVVHVILLAGGAALTMALPRPVPPGRLPAGHLTQEPSDATGR